MTLIYRLLAVFYQSFTYTTLNIFQKCSDEPLWSRIEKIVVNCWWKILENFTSPQRSRGRLKEKSHVKLLFNSFYCDFYFFSSINISHSHHFADFFTTFTKFMVLLSILCVSSVCLSSKCVCVFFLIILYFKCILETLQFILLSFGQGTNRSE